VSIKTKLLSNAFYISLNHFSIAFLNFLYWIVAGKMLLSEQYGIATTTISFITILSNLSLLGLGSSLRKLIPEYQAKNKKNKIYGIINYSFKLVSITNLFIFFLIITIVPFLARSVFNSKEMILPLYLSMIGIPLYSLYIIFISIIYGFQNMKLNFFSNFLGTLSKNIVSIILILLNFTYFGPILGFFVNLLLVSIILSRKIPFNKGRVDKKELKSYMVSGLAHIIFWLILNQSGYLILSCLDSLEAAGILGLIFNLALPIIMIPEILSSSAFPLLSQLYGKNDNKNIKKILFQIFRYALLITVPVSLFIFLFPTQIIYLLGNPSYLPGYRLLQVFSISHLILGIGTFFSLSLYALGKPNSYRNIKIIQSVVFLLITLLLVYNGHSFMSIGYSFLSVGIITFLMGVTLLNKYYSLRIEITPILKIIVSSLISVLFLLLMKPYVEGIFMIILTALTSTIIYCFILLILRFFREDDLWILNELKRKFPGMKKIFDVSEKIMRKYV